MTLQLASASLTQRIIGLADIRQFAIQCRDGAQVAGAEAAALILLAQKANSFYERYDGIALTNEALQTFVHNLTEDIGHLRTAAAAGDTALVDALNAFACDFSTEVII